MRQGVWALRLVWSAALLLVLWGLYDAPRRGDAGFLPRGNQVGALDPAGPAARAGLAAGDPVHLPGALSSSSLRARLQRLRPGDRLVLERGGDPPQQVILIAARPGAETVAWRTAWGAVALGFLIVGFAVFRARADSLGSVFLLFCTASALAFAPRPLWPWPAGSLAQDALSRIATLFLPVLLVHFFARFPEARERRGRRLLAVLYALAFVVAAGAPVLAPRDGALAERFAAAEALFFAAGVLAALGSFGLSWRRAGPRHRRRLHVLLACSAAGILPFVGLVVSSNVSGAPDPGLLRAAALLLLLVPAGFVYAIEMHQVLDFGWRRGGGEGIEARPGAPPVFPAADERTTVSAVANDLHARLGLAHCAAYRVNGGREAALLTWLGDAPADDVPAALCGEIVGALGRLNRPATTAELHPIAGHGAAGAQLVALERLGARLLMPLEAAGRTAAVLVLGPRLAEDVTATARRSGLIEYASHASLAVEHARFHDERVHQARIHRELEVARGIQERLRPALDPMFPTLVCAGGMRPSGTVGGDYYDYVGLGERRVGIAVADVCGKGVPAALLVAQVQANLRQRAIAGDRPSQALTALNRALAHDPHPEKFLCMTYAIADARTRSVSFANAGLHPPYWLRPGRAPQALPVGDLILGVDSATRYHDHTLQLSPGEGLLLFTDGVLDARRGREEFGEQRLPELLERWGHLRAPRLRDLVLEEASAFHQTGPRDDMTVVVVKAT